MVSVEDLGLSQPSVNSDRTYLLLLNQLPLLPALSLPGAFSRPVQVRAEPLNKIIVTLGATRNTQDCIGKIRLFRPEDIVASLDQQHSQIERRSLIAVYEAVIGDNSMNQCGGLFMDAAVITIVRAAKRRPNRMLTQNSGGTSPDLERIMMAS